MLNRLMAVVENTPGKEKCRSKSTETEITRTASKLSPQSIADARKTEQAASDQNCNTKWNESKHTYGENYFQPETRYRTSLLGY